MSYEKYYPGGWQSGESGGTPITPEALNHIENGIKQTYSDLAPAQEDASFPGCYYRMVNGIKEWINPPMIPGVEYRTTERWNGKAVYRKAVTYELSASIGTGGVLVPHNIPSFGELVRITGNASSRPFPVLYGGTETTTIYNVDGSSISVIGNKSDMGACTMYFDIAYTKA